MNQEQKELSIELDKFMDNKDNNYFLVTGLAGSGKTTSISNYFMEQRRYKMEDIVILAPTHKAKFVIKEKTRGIFECLTIHKFLGYSRVIDESGKITFIVRDNSEVENVKVIIVDECSMVNKYCFKKLKDKIREMDLKAIFMGDSNQLPPINETLSETFDIRNEYQLKECLRNDGEIYNVCDYMLKDLDRKVLDLKEHVSGSVMKCNRMKYMSELVKSKELDYKILCWTNARCNKMNKLMRDKIYGRVCDRYCNGEKLIVKNYFADMETNIYSSNEELIVKKVDRIELHTKDFDFVPSRYVRDLEGGVKVYKLELLRGSVIYVVRRKFESVIEKILKDIERDALMLRDVGDKENAKFLWEIYYRMRELFMPPVDYSYAITVHRSQGSEWDIIFVEMKDIMKNRKVRERNKLLYVAFSRAMEKLVICDG